MSQETIKERIKRITAQYDDRRLPDIEITVQPMGYVCPPSLRQLMIAEFQDELKERGIEISDDEASDILYESAFDLAKEYHDRLRLTEASFAEVIRQRDALISRELRRQESARGGE